jgi:hypothetical protein
MTHGPAPRQAHFLALVEAGRRAGAAGLDFYLRVMTTDMIKNLDRGIIPTCKITVAPLIGHTGDIIDSQEVPGWKLMVCEGRSARSNVRAVYLRSYRRSGQTIDGTTALGAEVSFTGAFVVSVEPITLLFLRCKGKNSFLSTGDKTEESHEILALPHKAKITVRNGECRELSEHHIVWCSTIPQASLEASQAHWAQRLQDSIHGR